jgi:hypothetical protein
MTMTGTGASGSSPPSLGRQTAIKNQHVTGHVRNPRFGMSGLLRTGRHRSIPSSTTPNSSSRSSRFQTKTQNYFLFFGHFHREGAMLKSLFQPLPANRRASVRAQLRLGRNCAAMLRQPINPLAVWRLRK